MNEDDVIEEAKKFGIALEQEEANIYVEKILDYSERLESLTDKTKTENRTIDIREADDEYNAFRIRFQLETADDGPLDDLFIAVKENIAIEGVPMSCGSAAFEYTPVETATALERLLEAGASLTGTTHMDEFAYGSRGEFCAHTQVSHPISGTRLPGGSSSGSAVAVATQMVDAAIGSDSGGSIRIPASLCGVVGFKPTFRTVPRDGLVHLGPSIDHIGPLTRSVADAARLYDAMNGPAVSDLSSIGVSRKAIDIDEIKQTESSRKVAIIEELLINSTSPVRNHIEKKVEQLEENGFDIFLESVPIIPDSWIALDCITGFEFTTYVANSGRIFGSGNWYDERFHEQLTESSHSGKYGGLAREMLLTTSPMLSDSADRHYTTSQRVRQQLLREINKLFECYDAILSPTTQITAPEPGEVDSDEFPRTLANTSPFNLTGHPALSIPAGTINELPVGLQIVTPWNTDQRTLQIGETIESIFS